MSGPGRLLAAGAVVLLSGGCTTFSSVRSAAVHPGVAVRAEGAVASPPGEQAAWFFNSDCSRCSTIPSGAEIGVDYGVVDDAGNSYSVGAHFNGFYPQLDGYALFQQNGGTATGVGARIGVPLASWTAHQIYGRHDRILSNGSRLLYNPAVGLHVGHSPNAQNEGHMISLIQAVGLEWQTRHVTFVPSVTLVLSTGSRTSYGESTSFSTAFATLSGSVTFHGSRE